MSSMFVVHLEMSDGVYFKPGWICGVSTVFHSDVEVLVLKTN